MKQKYSNVTRTFSRKNCIRQRVIFLKFRKYVMMKLYTLYLYAFIKRVMCQSKLATTTCEKIMLRPHHVHLQISCSFFLFDCEVIGRWRKIYSYFQPKLWFKFEK